MRSYAANIETTEKAEKRESLNKKLNLINIALTSLNLLVTAALVAGLYVTHPPL